MDIDFNIKDLNITIVGLGLMGGSFAKALKPLKPKNVWAIDIDGDALGEGVKLSIIDRGYLNPKQPLQDSDIVIICLYPTLVKPFIEANKDNFKKGSIITDVTGVKIGMMNDINSVIPKDIDFVFGHPMAGREKKGLEYSSAQVFQGANYIITPNQRNKIENIETIKWIAKNVGFKKVIELSPQKHDEVIAFTSQLPHVLAVALVNSDDLGIDTGSVVGDSYRELTRIAQINSELWTELFIENKVNLIQKIEILQENIEKIKNSILEEDVESLKEEFEESSSRRKNL
ncbi:MAG: prephenate dehydrogenase [Tissierella sp.]|uniref:prephenate dehydrogenase n=1 Tax=Tissierella sp. TaxID=41274 RepID=UPI003F96A281